MKNASLEDKYYAIYEEGNENELEPIESWVYLDNKKYNKTIKCNDRGEPIKPPKAFYDNAKDYEYKTYEVYKWSKEKVYVLTYGDWNDTYTDMSEIEFFTNKKDLRKHIGYYLLKTKKSII